MEGRERASTGFAAGDGLVERGERSGETDPQSSRRVTAAPGVCWGIVPPPVIISIGKEDQHE